MQSGRRDDNEKDFVQMEKHGSIFVTENRDVCIFPEKISGKY